MTGPGPGAPAALIRWAGPMSSRVRGWSIRKKLLASFGALAVVTVLVGGTSLFVLRSLSLALADTVDVRTPALIGFADLRADVESVLGAERSLLSMKHGTPPADAQRTLHSGRLAEVEAEWAKLTALPRLPGEAELRTAGAKALAEWSRTTRDVLASLAQDTPDGRLDAIDTSVNAGQGAHDALLAAIQKLEEAHKVDLQEAEHTQKARAVWTTGLVAVLVLLAAGLAVGLGFLMSRLIADPLRAMARVAQDIARGAVDRKIEHRSADEVGALADAFRDTIGYVQEVAGAADALARGRFDVTLAPRSEDDLLSQNVQRAAAALAAMKSETDRLTADAVAGKLSTRGRADAFEGGYAGIVAGMNATLDAVIGPLNVAAEYVDRIAKGDIPPRITDEYRGDFNEIRNNLNQCIDAIDALVADAHVLATAAVDGKLATRADATRHQGDFRRIVQGVNDTLDAVIGPLNVAAEYVDRIAKGDIPPAISDEYRGDFNELKNNLNTCIDAVNALVGDARLLATAAVEGKLATRADAARHQGDFRRIVQGVNDTLDAVIGPLNVAAQYVDRIAHGDIPERITDSYSGDFNAIKDNLNTCIDAVNALVQDSTALAEAATFGKLDTRADAARHLGDFRRIVQGVNATLDTIVGNLEAIPTPIQFMDREFRIQYINRAGADILGRPKAELESGSVRCGDAWGTAKCNNDECPAVCAMRLGRAYETENTAQVLGMDSDLACAAAPLFDAQRNVIGAFEFVTDQTAVKSAARTSEKIVEYQQFQAALLVDTLERLAIGDFAANVEFDAPDDDTRAAHHTLTQIRDAALRFKDAVHALAGDAAELTSAAIEGQLGTRADAARHQGGYREIMEGFNRTLDAVILPVQEATAVLEELAARNLAARVSGTYRGDHARLKEAVNKAAQNLDEALQNVTAAADQVASAAGQISRSSQSLARGSSDQASSLEEVAASLQEMASMTRRSADNAKQARTLADATLDSASHGTERMQTLSRAIEEIKDASSETARIVKTIDEIAFQTNLLALNAAVEAARAGDAGKGFAVVAEEVRNLAMRSAESARNTGGLIERAVRSAEHGVEVNAAVQEALEGIHGQARKVAEVMNEIAGATEQQTAGIGQVKTAVDHMNALTQETAANSEESASIAEELSSQSEEVRALVRGFRLTDTVSRG